MDVVHKQYKGHLRTKEIVAGLEVSDRIGSLRQKTLTAKRFLSIDQAAIITRVYKENSGDPVIIKRAKSLAACLREMPISIDPEELIAGNRTPGIRSGVVFPEAGITWLGKELDTLHVREQDPFEVRKEDAGFFREKIEPFWLGRTMEDDIYENSGSEINAIAKVVKINQRDHAQGHICPDVKKWLHFGPAGLLEISLDRLKNAGDCKRDFYESSVIVLGAACDFIKRYSELARALAESHSGNSLSENLLETASVCENIAVQPPEGFREALQSVWFLFVILQMESNSSSFSPGRMDQYLMPWYRADIDSGKLTESFALELIEALYIKFNHIVYLRNAGSAKYFAGFPIGFNVTIGGVTAEGMDAVNDLTWLFLKAQDHVRLPQPNLTARLHENSSDEFLMECSRVIGLGTGMPQMVNDTSIVPALENIGISHEDACDYALVGCVELSTQGNLLGWSDAAMFNLVKVLELTLNNGICMLTGERLGPPTGYLYEFETFGRLEEAFSRQIDYFTGKMVLLCEQIEKAHQIHLPSPFLSSVVNDCLESGIDVTAGGARYNLSGIQAIQVANIADSLEVLRQLVFEEGLVGKKEMLEALLSDFAGNELLRQRCINRVRKYGNDEADVDETGAFWIRYFSEVLGRYRNYRGGRYHVGLYTVSAHVPMGRNVAATPDGRLSGTPLADGGISPMYGRDKLGPTAVLNSASRLPFRLASNGTLLNMKFLPSFFGSEKDLKNFCFLLKAFVRLGIHHIQFNVVTEEDLLKAQAFPEQYKGLTIRVAGYTAYFTELAADLQNEIIKRSTYGG